MGAPQERDQQALNVTAPLVVGQGGRRSVLAPWPCPADEQQAIFICVAGMGTVVCHPPSGVVFRPVWGEPGPPQHRVWGVMQNPERGPMESWRHLGWRRPQRSSALSINQAAPVGLAAQPQSCGAAAIWSRAGGRVREKERAWSSVEFRVRNGCKGSGWGWD